MTKLFRTVITVCLVVSFILAGCSRKKFQEPEKGSTMKRDLSLYRLIPADASGFITIDFKKLGTGVLKKLFESGPGLGDFRRRTGIDPDRDIYAGAVVVWGNIARIKNLHDLDFAIIVRLFYDERRILKLFRDDERERYRDTIILKTRDDRNEDIAISLISCDIIALGKISHIVQVIDLLIDESKSSSFLDNTVMKTNGLSMKYFFNYLDRKFFLSFALIIPEELRKAHDFDGVFSLDLSAAELFWGCLTCDQEEVTWSGRFHLVSHNAEVNYQMVSTLENLKRLVSRVIPGLENSINFASTDDAVTMSFSVSDKV